MAEVSEMPQDGELVVFGLGVADVSAALQRFGWPDYVVFVLMLALCAAVGVYFGFLHAPSSAQEYLVGGRAMKTFPVAISLIASFISGISLLGIPTEIYVYGIQYLYICGGILLMALIFDNVYLPVFHNLQLTSTYEYLERRFDKNTRLLAAILFLIGMITWLPVVIYVPALAFNQVTGVNVHLITPCVCVICIFYTSVGGIKAVVWADVIQTFIMIGAMILVMVKGTLDIGGFTVVWQRNMESGRIEPPNFELDATTRHTIWTLTIGGLVYWLQASAVNQNMIQRYLSLPTMKTARSALWIFVFGVLVLTAMCGYTGMLIYATYNQCDPLTTQLAKEKDQLLPLLVMDVLGEFPGLPGLFMAGIFSAALSSLSTGLNSAAAVVLEDFYKTLIGKDLTERRANILMKLTVVITGSICVGLVFVVEKMGTVLQLTMSLGTIAAGPSLALISMGILLPWVNSKGALIGGLTGLSFMSWLCLNAQAAIASGSLSFEEKPVTTGGCHYHFIPRHFTSRLDSILNTTDVDQIDETFMMYRLSYLWYTLTGCCISMLVALVVSYVTQPEDPRDLDPALLAPFVRRLIPSRQFPNQPHSGGVILAYNISNAERNNLNVAKL